MIEKKLPLADLDSAFENSEFYLRIFECPIGLECMKDPVIAKDGYSYEKQTIEEYLNKTGGKGSSPLNPAVMLSIAELIPNRALKDAIGQQKKLFEKLQPILLLHETNKSITSNTLNLFTYGNIGDLNKKCKLSLLHNNRSNQIELYVSQDAIVQAYSDASWHSRSSSLKVLFQIEIDRKYTELEEKRGFYNIKLDCEISPKVVDIQVRFPKDLNDKCDEINLNLQRIKNLDKTKLHEIMKEVKSEVKIAKLLDYMKSPTCLNTAKKPTLFQASELELLKGEIDKVMESLKLEHYEGYQTWHQANPPKESVNLFLFK